MCALCSSSNSLGGQRNKLIKLVIWTGFTHSTQDKINKRMMSSHQLQTQAQTKWMRASLKTNLNQHFQTNERYCSVLTFTHIPMRKPNQQTEFRTESSFKRFVWCYFKREPFTKHSTAQANVYTNCRFVRSMNESCVISRWWVLFASNDCNNDLIYCEFW